MALLSPAKTLDFERPLPPIDARRPHFTAEVHGLVAAAAHLSPDRLARLMHISPPSKVN